MQQTNNSRQEQNSFEYFAFISYSHEDESWAKWIQRKLETYRFPSALRKNNETLPNKIFPIFRDQTDMESGVLWEKLKDSLEKSIYLIVVCSPNSARSKYVNKETEYFRSLGRNHQIIPVIVSGTPHSQNPETECFCPELLNPQDELVGVNVEELGKQKAILSVIATMTHLRFDSLVRRDKERRRKKTAITVLTSIVLLVAVLTSFKLLISPERSEKYANDSLSYLEQGDTYNAIINAQKSVRYSLFPKDDSLSTVALRSALVTKELSDNASYLHKGFQIKIGSMKYLWLGKPKDNNNIYLYNDAYIDVFDNQTGEKLEHLDANGLTVDASVQKEYAPIFGWELKDDGSGEYYLPFYDPTHELDICLENGYAEFKGNDLHLTNGKETYKLENIEKSKCSLTSSYDKSIFAVYDGKEEEITVVNIKSGLTSNIYFYGEKIDEIFLSMKGNYLYIPYSTGSYGNIKRKNMIYDVGKHTYIGSFDDEEVILKNGMEDYFLTVSNGILTKYSFKDYVPLEEKGTYDYGYSLYNKTLFNLCLNVKMSPNGRIAHYEYQDYDTYSQYTTSNHQFYSTETGELIYYHSNYPYFDEPVFCFDENMSIAVTEEKSFVNIKTKRKFYFESDIDFINTAINRSGTLIAAMDKNEDVYLYTVEGSNVERKKLFSFSELKKGSSFEGYDEDIIFFGVCDDYVVISSSEALYYYSITENKMYTNEKGRYMMFQNDITCNFYRDGLFFLQNFDGGEGCFIYNPAEHKCVSPIESLEYTWDYSEEAHLLCCTKSSGQQQSNPKRSVFEYKNGEFTKLYELSLEYEIVPVFSNDGKYLIINIEKASALDGKAESASRVYDAKTGTLLMELPFNPIFIINDKIYDIAVPCTMLESSTTDYYSYKELKSKALSDIY